MPFATVNGVSLYYRIDGPADARAPWLVLSNALGTDVSLWSPQIGAFARHFRVLRYDARGHGRSSVPPGPYTIEQLSADVLALMDALAIDQAHVCGISLGGVTAMALAARHGQRVGRLVDISALPRNLAPRETWLERMEQAQGGGMPALASASVERWLSAAFRAREPLVAEAIRDVVRHTDTQGYIASCAAVADTDLSQEVGRIAAPTLIVSGTHDAGFPVDEGRALAARIPGARHVAFEALHLPNVEQASALTQTVLDFLRLPSP